VCCRLVSDVIRAFLIRRSTLPPLPPLAQCRSTPLLPLRCCASHPPCLRQCRCPRRCSHSSSGQRARGSNAHQQWICPNCVQTLATRTLTYCFVIEYCVCRASGRKPRLAAIRCCAWSVSCGARRRCWSDCCCCGCRWSAVTDVWVSSRSTVCCVVLRAVQIAYFSKYAVYMMKQHDISPDWQKRLASGASSIGTTRKGQTTHTQHTHFAWSTRNDGRSFNGARCVCANRQQPSASSALSSAYTLHADHSLTLVLCRITADMGCSRLCVVPV